MKKIPLKMNHQILRTILLLLLATVAALYLPAQKNSNSHRFKITGVCTGFTDSTMLYLSDLADNTYKDIDSTLIRNGKFSFTGTLNEKIERFGIHTKGFKDRVTFWIDDTETTIITEKDKFRAATIIGAKAQAQNRELDSLISQSKNTIADYISFIQKNPASIVSANILSIYSASWNKDTVSMLYNQLTETAKATRYGKQIQEFITINKSVKIGDKFTDFTQPDVNGKNISLSDFTGKIILLDFWGSWCSPCRQEHPELIKLYNEYKDKGFEIFAVAAETYKKNWIEAIEQDKITWPNVSELKGDKNKAALIYGVSYYPSNFLIDRNGTIIAKDLRGVKLKEKLKELFH